MKKLEWVEYKYTSSSLPSSIKAVHEINFVVIMQEIYYETVTEKRWGLTWLLSITVLPLIFSYFYFDGYYFKAENMVPLTLTSFVVWYYFFKIKTQNKAIKFIIDGDQLTKVINDVKLSISMKDIKYLAIYRNEGKEPNTVDIKDDSGTVAFGKYTFNLAVLLIKTNQGVEMTIKLSFIPFEKLRILISAILTNVERSKDAVEGYDLLQSIYNSKADNIATVLGKATIASMSERNNEGVGRGRMKAYLSIFFGIFLGLLYFFFQH